MFDIYQFLKESDLPNVLIVHWVILDLISIALAQLVVVILVKQQSDISQI